MAHQGDALFPAHHEPVVMAEDLGGDFAAEGVNGRLAFWRSCFRAKFQVLQFEQALKHFHCYYQETIRIRQGTTSRRNTLNGAGPPVSVPSSVKV